MIGPGALPPSPAAVAEYFHLRRSTISEFQPEDILHNERLWVIAICGLDESYLDPAPTSRGNRRLGWMILSPTSASSARAVSTRSAPVAAAIGFSCQWGAR